MKAKKAKSHEDDGEVGKCGRKKKGEGGYEGRSKYDCLGRY